MKPETVKSAAAVPVAAPAEISPEAARALAKVRRLMLFSNLFVLLAVAAVIGVIGYRVFKGEGSMAPAPLPPPPPPPVVEAPPTDMTLTLPRGARILQSAVAEDLIVVTLEVDGVTEIRTFDLKTLKPVGRLSFGSVP